MLQCAMRDDRMFSTDLREHAGSCADGPWPMRGGVRGQARSTGRYCAVPIARRRNLMALLNIVPMCFSLDEGIVANLVNLQGNGVDREAEQILHAGKAM